MKKEYGINGVIRSLIKREFSKSYQIGITRMPDWLLN